MNERLRNALVAAHISRDTLASITDVDPKTVQRWLQGRVPHARHRWKIAELLKEHEDFFWPLDKGAEEKILLGDEQPSGKQDKDQPHHDLLQTPLVIAQLEHLSFPSSPAPVPPVIRMEETITLSQLTTAISKSIIVAMRELGRTEIGTFLAKTNVNQVPKPSAELDKTSLQPEMWDMDHLRRRLLKQTIPLLCGIPLASDIQPPIAQTVEMFERLAVAATKPSELNDVTLHQFEQLIIQGWELSNNNQLKIAEDVLSSILPDLLALPSHNARTARITSLGLNLQSVLAHHQFKIADKVLICKKSVEYARYAKDANVLIASLVELAAAYEFDHQFDKWLKTLQEALSYSRNASPLNQAHAYSYCAVALARHNYKREAEFYMQFAYDTFPSDPLADPNNVLADMNMGTLSYHAGLVCLTTGRISEAPIAFNRFKEHPSGRSIPERIRLEIVNGQSKAAIALNDLERYVDLFEDAITGSLLLGSKKRFDEAYTIFQQEIPATWLRNRQVRAVAEKYHFIRSEQ